ncbi:hypothetical protein [Amycolatopsis xylanica]|uniref:hypothetical protein n=1 Tax=Amycolatopsis xylanica TaxID=589385 RepID=UPI000B8A589A|nr:hypothetical protein [Amycolatopsis xylanica]
MARSRPGALRAAQARFPANVPERRIPGLSPRAREAIRLLEARTGDYNAIYLALDAYRQALRKPGRINSAEHPCPCCDSFEARDVLGRALETLPGYARAELGRLVAPLDAILLRRTVPYPWPERRPWATGWWHLRWPER